VLDKYDALTELLAVKYGGVEVKEILEEALLWCLGHVTWQKQIS